MSNQPSRRLAIKNIVAGTAALGASGMLTSFTQSESLTSTALKGNINHSVCRWCFSDIPLESFCASVKKLGLGAIDLIAHKEWPVLQKYGLYSSMCYIAGEVSLTKGFNNPAYHESLVKDYLEVIPMMKKAGYKDLICFSGSRAGMDDETGLKNCVAGLQKILPLAEKNGITIQMELLNSKVDHKDYMCDRTPWGVELVKRTGSANFKLLYDIYHMQVDEGDVIHTIRENHPYIGHYHTAGVPGRNEIDETQELYYPAIMRAIQETGFKGYVAQEFIPKKKDAIGSLREAILICDI